MDFALLKKHLSLFLIGFISLLFLGSCRQFFTTSLAPWAARDPSSLIPTVSSDNIKELLEKSANNPDQSLALLDKIADAVAAASAADAAVLQAAALEVASNASGVATAVLSNTGDLLEALDNDDDIIPIVSTAIAGLSNLGESAALLAQILPDPGTGAFNAFVAQATPEALAMAAIVLLAAEAQASGGVESYINSFDPNSPDPGTETLAVALAEAAATAYAASGGTGPLADMLSGLNLTP
ncbi:hypothetical protein [Gracilinema caldarium]|uniref:Uncharacterized protein n=1 Tax=Gracilinema caldarium (strain ATCC 51460 / DSM 7334 / H1) TaxID=744872 RepID=F8F0F4_GRAC1|nr:hypothetical protein [Gracilinema caldarium]AEJ19298.1 hypothetical protein Spica_1152 [Gracilinema caldarium DSM 7334]